MFISDLKEHLESICKINQSSIANEALGTTWCKLVYDLDALHALSSLNMATSSVMVDTFISYLKHHSISIDDMRPSQIVSEFHTFLDTWVTNDPSVFDSVFGLGIAILLFFKLPPSIEIGDLIVANDYTLFLLCRSYRHVRIKAFNNGVTLAHRKVSLFQPSSGLFFLDEPYVFQNESRSVCHGFVAHHDSCHVTFFGDIYAYKSKNVFESARQIISAENFCCLADFTIMRELARYPSSLKALQIIVKSQLKNNLEVPTLLERIATDEQYEEMMRQKFVIRAFSALTKVVKNEKNRSIQREDDEDLDGWISWNDQLIHATFAKQRAQLCSSLIYSAAVKFLNADKSHLQNIKSINDGEAGSKTLLSPYEILEVCHTSRINHIFENAIKTIVVSLAHARENFTASFALKSPEMLILCEDVAKAAADLSINQRPLLNKIPTSEEFMLILARLSEALMIVENSETRSQELRSDLREFILTRRLEIELFGVEK